MNTLRHVPKDKPPGTPTERARLPPRPKIRTRASPAIRRRCQSAPTEQDIRIRAYYLSLERGLAKGNPIDDWLRAEHELRQSLSQNPGRRR
jgi:hypothetical protein